MKLTNSLFFTTLALTLPISAFAATTLTFEGEVSSQTCTATINGQTNSTILLPTVTAAELDAKGKTAGLTPFTINIADCTAGTTDLKVSTKFLGHNVTSQGNLGNLAKTNAAENVSIQLTTSAEGTTGIVLNGATTVAGPTLAPNETTATYQYGAQYYAEDTAKPGAITAIVEYTLSYN